VFSNVYLNYLPDFFTHESVVNDKRFLDYTFLKRKFIFDNRKNNNGDQVRLLGVLFNLNEIDFNSVSGNFAELGVYKGNMSSIFSEYAVKFNRELILFDTFKGFDSKDIVGVDKSIKVGDFSNTSIKNVKELLNRDCAVTFIEGWFPDSLKNYDEDVSFSVVSLDCDLYQPIKAGLEYFYPRLSKGGIIFIHDYLNPAWPGVRLAVQEYFKESLIGYTVLPDKSGTCIIKKI
jgi:hypothetical protein